LIGNNYFLNRKIEEEKLTKRLLLKLARRKARELADKSDSSSFDSEKDRKRK